MMDYSEDRETCDLHIHSNFSDGTFSPTEVAETAAKVGLTIIALTDHDEVGGLEEAIKAGEKLGVRVLSGVEMSCVREKREVHILGYFIDHRSESVVKALREFGDKRQTRGHEIVARLQELGIPITVEEVESLAGEGVVARPHIAQVLQRKGVVKSVQEAFDRFLADGRPAYVPKAILSVEDACRMIREWGGIPVMAHPGLVRNDSWIPEFQAEGIQGIEVRHTEYGHEDEIKYMKMAKDLNLLPTGGSDCHGMAKGRVFMGSVRIPVDWVEALEERVAQLRSS